MDVEVINFQYLGTNNPARMEELKSGVNSRIDQIGLTLKEKFSSLEKVEELFLKSAKDKGEKSCSRD